MDTRTGKARPPASVQNPSQAGQPNKLTLKTLGPWLLLAGGVSALLAGPVLYFSLRTDPRVLKLKTVQADLFSEATRNLPDDERKAKWDAYRQEVDQLPDKLKQLVRTSERRFRDQQSMEPIRAFFALPDGEKTAYLDREIDAQEQRRKQFEQARAAAAQGQAGGAQARPAGAGQNPRGAGGPGGQGGERRGRTRGEGGGFRGGETTLNAEEQALRSEYYRLLQDRRQQRGLPAGGPGGGPPGGGRQFRMPRGVL